LALVFTFTIAATAQTALKSQYLLTTDTVTNTGSKYLTLTTPATAFFKAAEVAVTVTEINGTTGGTLSIEASLDNVNWYSLYGGMAASYTFTPLDVATAQSFRFYVPNWADNYVRIKYVGTGTMVAAVSAKAVFKN